MCIVKGVCFVIVYFLTIGNESPTVGLSLRPLPSLAGLILLSC
jgi:hypothetical protein